MIEGDANGRGFQYPIPTYSITKDLDWSPTENNKLLFEMTAKYGTPYFSNYINSDMEPSDVRSMCCRLRLDLRELRKKSGGYFGSGESTGSIGVVTLNMPRLAYLAKDEADFFRRLDKLHGHRRPQSQDKARRRDEAHERGALPLYTKRYLGSFRQPLLHHRPCRHERGGPERQVGPRGHDARELPGIHQKTLNHMLNRLSDYQEKYGDLYNLEATPAESTSYRLAKHDVERYPDIITAAEPGGTPYYTNSSHLPVGYTEDIFAALDIQDELQTPLHLRHGVPRLPGREVARLAGRGEPRAQDRGELQAALLHALSPTYSVCKNDGYLAGGAVHLPALRRERGGLQPHHRLLPPGAELERRQDAGSTRSARPMISPTATSTP